MQPHANADFRKDGSLTIKTFTKMATKRVKRTKDGTVDLRTKEGRVIAARMAKARKAKGSLKNRIKRLFR